MEKADRPRNEGKLQETSWGLPGRKLVGSRKKQIHKGKPTVGLGNRKFRATFFSTLKHFFSTLTFFFNPATFLFHPRTLFFDPVTFFFNPCTCFFDPGPFFFNPIHLGPPDFPAARSASFTLDGSSSSRLPAYKLWAVGGPIWGLQWSGWVLEAT